MNGIGYCAWLESRGRCGKTTNAFLSYGVSLHIPVGHSITKLISILCLSPYDIFWFLEGIFCGFSFYIFIRWRRSAWNTCNEQTWEKTKDILMTSKDPAMSVFCKKGHVSEDWGSNVLINGIMRMVMPQIILWPRMMFFASLKLV